MTMITPSYLGETIEYSSLHACRSTLEDPTQPLQVSQQPRRERLSICCAGLLQQARQIGQAVGEKLRDLGHAATKLPYLCGTD